MELLPSVSNPFSVLLIWIALGYGLGSIPFGVLLTRVMGLGNLRDIGSGNIGATNVLRTGNKAAAALTLCLDAGKGAAAVLLARALAGEDAAQLAGLASFIGHCFPIWLSFKGGKGVATFLGLVLALGWPVGIACCVTWLAVAKLSKISSVGGMSAAVLSPIWAVVMGYSTAATLCAALAVIILIRHHENITRLMAGTESKIGKS